MIKRKKAFMFCIIAILVLNMFMRILSLWLDNDIYFMLALGKHIVNNGVPKTNPFFLGHEIKTLVPQWLYDVFVFEIYDKVGYIGLFVIIFIFLGIGTLFLYKISRIHNADPFLSILLITAYWYINTASLTVRPNLLSVVLCIIQLYLMECYSKDSKIRYIIPLPFISLLEINTHVSMWAMHLCIMAAYLCPQFRLPIEINKHEYKIKPLIYVTAIMIEAGLLNPYGFDAMMFLRDGISEDSVTLIAEMAPASMGTSELVGMLVCAGVIMHVLTKRKTYYQYFYLFLGWFFLGTQYSRNFTWGYLGILMISFQLLHDTNFEDIYIKTTPKKWIGFWPFVAFAIIIVLDRYSAKIPETEGLYTPYGAIEYIQAHSPEGASVLTEYDTGGFFEWNGCKTFIDPRADGYMPGFTGGYDILHEYSQGIIYGDWNYMRTIIEKYDFDYAYVYSTMKWQHYFETSEKYECVYVYEKKSDSTGQNISIRNNKRGMLYRRIE